MFLVVRFNPKRESLTGRSERLKGKQSEREWKNELRYENELMTENFSYLLSLMLHREKKYYYGDPFIFEKSYIPLHDEEFITEFESAYTVWLMILSTTKKFFQNHDDIQQSEIIDWHCFPLYEKTLKFIVQQSEKLLLKGKDQVLIYVGELLKQAANASDEKLKFITLVSAIELLLTHNPDFNRFNVEDSITKQFILKSAILIYKRDKSQSIQELANRLKTIYAQRSNIAHGNFVAFYKFLSSFEKYNGNDQHFFSDLITDCYHFLKLILEEYFEDVDYVEFLKER
jgi:hypothetical protein